MAKNNSIKITILATTLIVAASAVIIFLKTTMEPPEVADSENLHNKSVVNDIDNLSRSESVSFNDSLYSVIIDKLEVFATEDLISEDKRDDLMKNFVDRYFPIFKDKCYSKFNTYGWSSDGLDNIQQRIGDLFSLELAANGEKVVQDSNKIILNEINLIINNYYKAKQATYNTSYQSISEAENAIKTANYFANMDYISNSDLRDGLLKVKEKIATSHYNKVYRLIHELGNYRSYSKEGFAEVSGKADNALTNYDNNKQSLYGSHAKNTGDLHSYAEEAWLQAGKYYGILPQEEYY